MISSRSIWAQSSLLTKFVAGVVVMVGFALLFFVESIYGKKSSLLISVILALIPSVTFAVSILFLSVGLIRMRQEQSTWYKQQNFLLGIVFVFVAFSLLTTVGSVTNILSPLLAFFLGLACIVLAFLCLTWSILSTQGKQKS